ncbi:MAG: hypothetical protein ABMA26_09715 [Limisphaerales bacterium]
MNDKSERAQVVEPAPYPPNNTAELAAVITFLGLLDLSRVKPEARFLDKVPNLDGSIELVDEDQRPIGELKIQIKKIPDNALSFDCPIELVAYSTRVTSPFVLVCVDVGSKKAYWRHLSQLMPEFKPDQKTFTVRFQPVVHEVGVGSPYIEQWQDLCADYLRRVSEHPRLKQTVETEIGLIGLSYEDRRAFQQFVDEVNVLLDVDLPVVKHERFADAWKLGVSIHEANAESVCYSVYTIANGENAPLLTYVPHETARPDFLPKKGDVVEWHLEGGSRKDVSKRWVMREFFRDPVKSAKDFVFGYLEQLLRKKLLHVHGRNQSVELIMWFMRSYAHTLGLPVADTYTTKEIVYGVQVYLPMWYSIAYPRTMKHFQENWSDMLRCNPFPSFEQIARSKAQPEHPSATEVRDALASGKRPARTFVRTDTFSFQSLWQAVDFLTATGVQEICRLDRPRSKNEAWVWDCYSAEELKHNTSKMLIGAAEDYSDFVKGNRFGRLDSRLLSGEVAMIYTIDSRKWENSQRPGFIDDLWVNNPDRSLPIVTLIDLAEEADAIRFDGGVAEIRGVRRECIRSRRSIMGTVFDDRPIQKLLYELLDAELAHRYDVESLVR